MRSLFWKPSTGQFPMTDLPSEDWPLFTVVVTTGGTSLEWNSICTGSPRAIRPYWVALSKLCFGPATSPMRDGRRDCWCPQPPMRKSSTLRSCPGRAMRRRTANAGRLALAQSSAGERRVSFANYFNRIGKPTLAAALLGGAQLPVSPENARWNAVIAQSMALQGRVADAKQLFDRVLQAEPDQLDALRGRSALESRAGMPREAVVDAQRLVSASPNTGEDRLLLAQAFLAAGKQKEVTRTLWQAFQDLPEDERVLGALKSVLISSGDLDGVRRLNDEFADQRKAKLVKDLV